MPTNTSSLSSQIVRETQEKALLNLDAGRALITRSYLSELAYYPVSSPDQRTPFSRATDMRVYRIERIVQDNKQSVLESTTAAYTALGAAGYAVFLFLRSNGCETELFIGTRGEPGKMLGQNSGDLLRETFRGHFPGSALHPLKLPEANALFDQMEAEKENASASITAVTGVPALSTENRDHFMQGLERFIDAAENHVYQALILADPVSSQSLDVIRIGYEQVATQLSPLAKLSLTYGEQDSASIGLNISQGLSNSLGHSLGLTETRGTSHTVGTSIGNTTGSSHTVGTSTGESHGTTTSFGIQAGRSTSHTAPTVGSRFASIIGAGIGIAGNVYGPIGGVIGSQIGSMVSSAFNASRTTGTNLGISGNYGVNSSTSHGTNESRSTNQSTTESNSESHGTSRSESTVRTHTATQTANSTQGQSFNQTDGSSRQMSIETVDKTIEQLLGRIDHHLQRIDEAKTYGGWNTAAYFIGDSSASSEALASIFLGLIRGSKSSHEDFALTTWTSSKKSTVIDWLTRLNHPELQSGFDKRVPISFVTPATLVSGKEMAIQLSLPRRSTSTVSVVETQVFGRKVQRLDGQSPVGSAHRTLELGHIRHLWENLPQTIKLDMDQLSSHMFISGSTGAGKSNTLYEILEQISAAGVPFLVIEPAKGEYKNVFGQRPDVSVLGTNPAHSAMLRINPFGFPAGIHVLEHVDRLIEIFNVCWPMYAAMPAVLKDAILQAYQKCGWDLETSCNRYSEDLFPTFVDLLGTLEEVIAESAYSPESKGNYTGALCTRIKSLTNGLNGQLFGTGETDNTVLFDSNVIVDLSRIGSVETKALIMGILIMRLSEHRMVSGGMNLPLQHVTVLEEAHNILKRSPEIGNEESGLVGKSVEMLTNAIAEMRTYGEGFIIVDQSPHAVDIAAIRNTNTKIIMRLPDESDRRLLGKSIALSDDQLEEITRLPKGVAIVYQNDWLEPVLCQISKFRGKETPYHYHPDTKNNISRYDFNLQLAKMLLITYLGVSTKVDTDLLQYGLSMLPFPSHIKISLLKTVEEYKSTHNLDLHKTNSFDCLAGLLVDALGCRSTVRRIVEQANDYTQLCRLLRDLVLEYIPGASVDLALAAEHCMMKDYSVRHEHNVGIYSAWRAQYEKVGIQ
ncbi:MAG: DUF87 domain-containing protein [Gluconobacter sp.]|uniref:ATP-binding protein n=1 Tax=Acetobacter aceti TaxID=435 RepID=A0A1U9KDR6_ACEAC|nr:DUF87 domain-containing protein [Acetobacter aceti]AQS83877.1 ATP-binding protein [Acetobacter aceti]